MGVLDISPDAAGPNTASTMVAPVPTGASVKRNTQTAQESPQHGDNILSDYLTTGDLHAAIADLRACLAKNADFEPTPPLDIAELLMPTSKPAQRTSATTSYDMPRDYARAYQPAPRAKLPSASSTIQPRPASHYEHPSPAAYRTSSTTPQPQLPQPQPAHTTIGTLAQPGCTSESWSDRIPIQHEPAATPPASGPADHLRPRSASSASASCHTATTQPCATLSGDSAPDDADTLSESAGRTALSDTSCEVGGAPRPPTPRWADYSSDDESDDEQRPVPQRSTATTNTVTAAGPISAPHPPVRRRSQRVLNSEFAAKRRSRKAAAKLQPIADRLSTLPIRVDDATRNDWYWRLLFQDHITHAALLTSKLHVQTELLPAAPTEQIRSPHLQRVAARALELGLSVTVATAPPRE